MRLNDSGTILGYFGATEGGILIWVLRLLISPGALMALEFSLIMKSYIIERYVPDSVLKIVHTLFPVILITNL